MPNLKTALLTCCFTFSVFLALAQEYTTGVSAENKFDLMLEAHQLADAGSIHDVLPIDEHCQVLSFGVLRVPKENDGTQIQEFFAESAVFTENMVEMLGKCRTGDRLYFDNIRTVADCSQYQGNGSTSYVVEVR